MGGKEEPPPPLPPPQAEGNPAALWEGDSGGSGQAGGRELPPRPLQPLLPQAEGSPAALQVEAEVGREEGATTLEAGGGGSGGGTAYTAGPEGREEGSGGEGEAMKILPETLHHP